MNAPQGRPREVKSGKQNRVIMITVPKNKTRQKDLEDECCHVTVCALMFCKSKKSI